MNFQAVSNTFQNHTLQAVHQIGKILGDYAEILSYTGFLGWHMYDLRVGIKVFPASLEF